ncbi:hypothetical protein J5X84_29425 [Streptosporangiaceae bacterium NEAU-GS5]|nr:hypothetical protein [Streptosporangiaceae bacterium NEAU-GS5]
MAHTIPLPKPPEAPVPATAPHEEPVAVRRAEPPQALPAPATVTVHQTLWGEADARPYWGDADVATLWDEADMVTAGLAAEPGTIQTVLLSEPSPVPEGAPEPPAAAGTMDAEFVEPSVPVAEAVPPVSATPLAEAFDVEVATRPDVQPGTGADQPPAPIAEPGVQPAAAPATQPPTAQMPAITATPVSATPAVKTAAAPGPKPQAVRTIKRATTGGKRAAAKGRTRSAVWWQASATTRIGQDAAVTRVLDAGLHLHSSGHCSDPRHPWCTSLQSIRLGTIAQVIELRRRSGCKITITGGTETGHAPGPYSHSQGYKVDVAHNACIDSYVKRNFTYTRIRGDGAPLYRSDSDDVYASEPDHWDILYR